MKKNMELLTAKDIMRIFGVTRKTVYVWMVDGVLPPPVKLRGKIFWSSKVIEDLLNKKSKKD